MSDEIKNVPSRRSAIKTAAQVAVTAPAVGLLLSAGTKAASANIHYGDDSHITVTPATTGDDNTYDATPITRTGATGDDYFTF